MPDPIGEPTPPPPLQTDPSTVGVAAFDFDGTLTTGDALIPFLARLSGRRRVAVALAAQARTYRRDSDAAKLDLLRRVTAGVDRSRLDELGRDYAVGLHHRLRPDMMARLRRHRHAGHRLVIVSASLGAYLRPFGETLGFDEVIAVELEVSPSGLLTGAVTGGVNVRGPEKARRLNEWLTATLPAGARPEVWAYGDSSGDTDLLAMADHPTKVTKRGVVPPDWDRPVD